MSTDAKWMKVHNSKENDQKSRRRSNGFFSIDKSPEAPIGDEKKDLNLRKKQKLSYEEPVDEMLLIETSEDSENEEEETEGTPRTKSHKRKRTSGLIGIDVDPSIWRQLPHSVQEELLCNPKALKMQSQAAVEYTSSDQEDYSSDDSGYASDDALNVDDYLQELKTTKWKNKQKKIVIIGAGMAGVAAARQLHDIGFHVTIVEARSRIGGRIHTVTTAQLSKQGIGVDIGGAFIHGTGGNPLTKLAKGCKAQLRAPGDRVALYDCNGQLIDKQVDNQMEKVFNDLLNACDFVRDKFYSDNRKQKRSKKNSVPFVTAVEDMISKTPKRDSKKEKKSCCKVDGQGVAADIKNGKDISLGHCLSTILPLYEKTSKKLTDQDKRVLDWHISNIEGPCGCDIGLLSLRHWDQDDPYEFTGEHSMIKQGYGFLVDSLAEGIDIQLDQKVTKIEYNPATKKVTVHATNPSKKNNSNSDLQLEADVVLCTLPLGVLKQKSVEFIPPLPSEKIKSIENLGFGIMNKVALFYEKPFWDQNADYIGYASDNRGEFYLFVNMYKLLGVPSLVAIVTGQAAIDVESKSSKVVLAKIHAVMKTIYGSKAIKPERTVITRWRSDPFACGSYSYVATGCSGKDYDILGQAVSDYLFFAGEATIRTHPSTVSGAYISGIKAAWNIARACQLQTK